MRKRAEKGVGGQGAVGVLRQALMPLVAGAAETKRDLLEWVHRTGMEALDELFRADAEAIAGVKGKHRADRRHHHWGKADAELDFGGRRVRVKRPRVRERGGREVPLPSVEAFRCRDPLAERVVTQLLLGVSTRGYEQSLGSPPPVPSRGTSKSAASRRLVAATRGKLHTDLARRLDDVGLVALLLDGIQIGERTLVVALGVSHNGDKVPLGLWQGSTENAAVCIGLLQDLLERGLRVEAKILCVIDGGKGLRKALRDVLGDLAVIQRCQVHKLRNVLDLLPETQRTYVRQTMQSAYRADRFEPARKRLLALVAWLARQGEEQAAASLREGLDETLTVVKLKLPSALRRSLATTNAIENVMGQVRRVTRNVKRWKGDMARRWTWLAIADAQRRFHRLKGHRDLPQLRNALDALNAQVDGAQEAA
jgi:putative transposase